MIALPIKTVNGKAIQLQNSHGKTYTYRLAANTLYCRGERGTQIGDT